MNATKNIVRTIATTSVRRAAPATKDIPKGYFELRKIQEKFQVKDGKPIFLKGGPLDQILYRVTMGLSVVGVGGILKLIYDLSYPKTSD